MTPTQTTEFEAPAFDRAKFQAAIHELFPEVRKSIKVAAEKHSVEPRHLAGILVSQIVLNVFKVPRAYEENDETAKS